MKHTFLGALLLLILLAMTACAPDSSITDYQSRPLHLLVAFEIGGVEAEAEVTLGEGGAERDVTLCYTAPAEAAGLTFSRTGGKWNAVCGDKQIPQGDLSAAVAPLTLFCIPESARVTGIEKNGSKRTATMTDGETVYTLCFEGGGDIPRTLSRSAGQTHVALTVLSVLP